jgi:signal transduction histidine kinase
VTPEDHSRTYGVRMGIRAVVKGYGDVVLAVALAAAMSAELMAWAGDDLDIALLLGLVATLPLAARQRAPLISFTLTMLGLTLLSNVQKGFDNDSMSFVVTLFVALYSLGRHARGLEGRLGGAAIAALMVLFAYGDNGDTFSGIDLGDIAFDIVFVGAPWAAGLTLRLRREREAVLTAENVRIRLEQEENTRRAIASERATIARELHDVVAHAISVTVLQARGARRMLGRDEATVRRSLDAIEHTNTQALGDMRRLLALLRDTEGDAGTSPQPSLARLDELVADVRDSGLPVEVESTGDHRDVPPGVDLSAYRIIQEALTNALKHAGPARATVRLTYGTDDLTLCVSDTGTGPTSSNGTGHGLVGIRERVAVVGGEIEAGAGEGGGFVVRARLPYSVEAVGG